MSKSNYFYAKRANLLNAPCLGATKKWREDMQSKNELHRILLHDKIETTLQENELKRLALQAPSS